MNVVNPPAQERRNGHAREKRWINVLVQRQLEDISSGNGAYIDTFLKAAKSADLNVRILFAPWHSFGNRPWAAIHPRLLEKMDDVIWPCSIKVGERFVSTSPRVWFRFLRRAFLEARRRLGSQSLVQSYLGRPLDLEERERLSAAANAHPAEITMAEYSSLGPVLNHLTYATHRTCLIHDLWSDRALRFQSAGLPIDFYNVSFEREIHWIDACDSLIFASANEMQKVSPHIPGAAAVWLRPDAPDYKIGSADGPVRLVFIGTTHGGNALSLDHFIDEIWPLVHRRLPHLTLDIAGSIGKNLTPERAGVPGVRVLGRVEDLSSVGGANAIGIAPTKLATGVSIKVAEYLLLGMPTVVYPLALEGFGPVLDDLVRQADTPETFAAAIIELAENHTARSALAAKAVKETRQRLSNAEVVRLLS
jgi:hypothetical protein